MKEHKTRLIDANALYDRYKHLSLQNGSCLGRHSGIAEEFLDAILNAPTIDPDSLRPQGKWEEIRNAYSELEGWIHKDCGREVKTKENYCPNCGAKMEDYENE